MIVFRMRDKYEMKTVEYGCGENVIVLHGGPAAAGSARGLAMGIAGLFHVYEPWQRGSGAEPLSVMRHVEDLYDLVSALDGKPALVGHSWGAMLALAYAAEHPETVGPVVLVGSGTFDVESRSRFREIVKDRRGEDFQAKVARAVEGVTDPSERFLLEHSFDELVYAYAPVHNLPEAVETPPPFDAKAHQETWGDAIHLQEQGYHPQAFSKITSPVLMLHGAYDPHPGQMIYDNLKQHISHLEYMEWEECGHEPWVEKSVREDFFRFLILWLTENTGDPK